jgi:hypothetical protein
MLPSSSYIKMKAANYSKTLTTYYPKYAKYQFPTFTAVKP